MNPFFFGDSGRELYGVHHPPRGSTPRSAGVVLCYPFAQEYMRAHRAFRQLSLLLSGEGFHVLRFDYTGTGDSAGEPSDMSVAGWQDDLAVAIEELMDMAAVESVWIVGLRLGGAVALEGARRAEVRGVVLWDPIISGDEQLAEGMTAAVPGGSPIFTVGGITISSSLRDEMNATDLMRTPVRPQLKTLLAVSSDTADFRAFRDRLSRDDASVTYTCVPSDGRWSLFDNWGSALIPQELIRAIVHYLKRM